MKKLLWILFLPLACASQTIPSYQVRPSATNGQVLTTVNGSAVWNDPVPGPQGPSGIGADPQCSTDSNGHLTCVTVAADTTNANLYQVGGRGGVWGQSLQSKGAGSLFGPSPVFSLSGVSEFGDSITNCVGTATGTANQNTCYSKMLTVAAGPGGSNYSVSGSWSLDMGWQVFSFINPAKNGNIPSTILCCTNDAYQDFNANGSSTVGRQANATHALTALAAWSTIPQGLKLSGANYTTAGCTTSGTVEVSNYGNLTTIALESVGASVTCPTLQSGPMAQYYAWLADSGGTATASFSLDSGTVTDTWNNFGYNGKSISTVNNPTIVAPIATRYVPISSGSHTFTVACTANCAPQGGIIGGIYLNGASASGTPGNTCVLTFSNGGTATIPIAPNGQVIASEIPLTITSAGSAITGLRPTTGTVSNGTASNCSGTANVLLWTRGPFEFAFEASPTPATGLNIGNQTINPPALYMGGTIRAMQSYSFASGTGAQMNPYADTYNNIVKSVADQLYADGAYAVFVDVRNWEGTDYQTLDSDMQAATLPNGQATLASTNPGLHPTGNVDATTGRPVGGHPHLFDAFAAAMLPNLAVANVAQVATQRVGGSTTVACSDGSVYLNGTSVTLPSPSTCPAGHDSTVTNFGDNQMAVSGTLSSQTPTLIQPHSSATYNNQSGSSWYLKSITDTRQLTKLTSGNATCDADNRVFLLSGTAVIDLPSVSVPTTQIRSRCRYANIGTTLLSIPGAMNNIPTFLPPGNSIDVQLQAAPTVQWYATDGYTNNSRPRILLCQYTTDLSTTSTPAAGALNSGGCRIPPNSLSNNGTVLFNANFTNGSGTGTCRYGVRLTQNNTLSGGVLLDNTTLYAATKLITVNGRIVMRNANSSQYYSAEWQGGSNNNTIAGFQTQATGTQDTTTDQYLFFQAISSDGSETCTMNTAAVEYIP